MPNTRANARTWGRSVENQSLRVLRVAWPSIARVGSTGYIRDHADLMTPLAEGDVLPLLVTKEKGAGKPLLVTLELKTFVDLVTNMGTYPAGCVVQCKGRQSMWANKVYAGLVKWLRSSQQ